MSSYVGGSAQHRPTRVRKPKISGEGKVLNAIQRAGELSYLEIKNSWSVLKVGNHQEDKSQARSQGDSSTSTLDPLRLWHSIARLM